MKKIHTWKERGIPLQRLNFVMLIAAALISIILFSIMYRTSVVYKNTHEATQELVDWLSQSSDMQVASDYLTEQIRSFVITGERQYLTNYFEEVQFSKRRENALSALKGKEKIDQAYQELSMAMEGSLKLMDMEYYAARLTIEACGYHLSDFPEVIRNTELTKEDQELSAEQKKERARAILFDNPYHAQKQYISQHINACFESIKSAMNGERLQLANSLKRHMLWEHIMTDLLILILLLIVAMTNHMVFIPLRKAVNRIRDEKDILLKGAYEIRFLAKTYNLMYQTNLESKERLSYEATHDKLTGLYNRRGYEFLLKNIDLDTSALLLIDLDEFKSVNDTYGHDIGDKVLTKVSDAVLKSFRSQDYMCRIGGDEFAVIMIHAEPDLTELIRRKFEKINDYLQEEEEGVPTVSISVGVTFGEDGHVAEQIFKEADTALYFAKNMGKHGIAFHHELEAAK